MWAVIDHVTEADVLIAVFTRKDKARKWIKQHKNDSYATFNSRRYESLAVEEVDIDPE